MNALKASWAARRGLCLWIVSAASLVLVGGTASAADDDPTPLILAHYMPWYEAKPVSERWGWHWTMNFFEPDTIVDGRRQIASKLYPAIGPYDSSDPLVIDYHLLLMKLAGIDGVMVDWYGRERFNDYAQLHRNTARLITRAGELGLKVVVCYEDRTIPELVKGGRVPAGERAAHAAKEINWLVENWFDLDHYVKVDGKPLLLSFGTANLDDREWTDALRAVSQPIAYVSQQHKRSAAIGGFDWPVPSQGLAATERFYPLAEGWPFAIPVAFPRFDDIYQQANVHASHGSIADAEGATFRTTLEAALKSKAPIVQIVTWNDWGEGTVIEPSEEFGTRDLEVVQELRTRYVDGAFKRTKEDLSLPARLLAARRAAADAARRETLDSLVTDLASGGTEKVRAALDATAEK